MKEAHAAERWSPPSVGSLTCNVDANLTGAGVCVWDHHGRVVATRTNFRGPCLTVAEGEEWVLLKALMLLSSLGMQNVYFEVLLIAHL